MSARERGKSWGKRNRTGRRRRQAPADKAQLIRRVKQYARRATSSGMFSRLLQRAFGGVGDLLAAMIGLQGPGQPDTADIAAAVGMMEAAGLPVDPPGEENTKPPPLRERKAAE